MEQKWHCLPSLCNVSANCEQHFDTVTTFYHMACYEKQFTNNVNKKKKKTCKKTAAILLNKWPRPLLSTVSQHQF